MTRALALGGVFVALALIARPSALGADASANPSRSSAAVRAGKAKGQVVPAEPVQPIRETQLQLADRVLTGDVACEFNQVVNVSPVAGQPGHFQLRFKRTVYTVIPEETTSGALRLEDKKTGIVWLQIPSKSMLMNARLGQRLVDGCTHPEQRAAVAAVEAAASAMAAGERKP